MLTLTSHMIRSLRAMAAQYNQAKLDDKLELFTALAHEALFKVDPPDASLMRDAYEVRSFEKVSLTLKNSGVALTSISRLSMRNWKPYYLATSFHLVRSGRL